MILTYVIDITSMFLMCITSFIYYLPWSQRFYVFLIYNEANDFMYLFINLSFHWCFSQIYNYNFYE